MKTAQEKLDLIEDLSVNHYSEEWEDEYTREDLKMVLDSIVEVLDPE